jgi:radical SAM superfamily enzyme YgiQ (UPF0313 family)
MQLAQLANPHSKHYDVLICTVPWTDTDIPLMAPAALKKVVEAAGKSCLAVDTNAEIYKSQSDHIHLSKFIKFYIEEKLDPTIEQEVYELFDSLAKQILSFSPEYIGLSVFSYACQTPTKWLCYFIKKHNPNVKIIIGGAGCLPTLTGNSKFVKSLISSSLVDYHIRGDAEHSLYQLLTGNDEYDGINSESWTNLTNDDLTKLPIPDYSDYHFDFYKIKALPMIGSRGCVRNCTFCDYITNWKKFQWRTADHVFEEMVEQNKKYKINRFKFQDSLINGNLKEFNRLLELLVEHNESNPDNKFHWGGFYIFRERSATSDKEWEMIHKSGVIQLAVGIENFSQRIRYAMGKKFSNESIIFHLEHALKYNIQLALLQIVGYIDETQEDIDYAKKWLQDNTRFSSIINFTWGTGLSIFENTYLSNNKDALGITLTGKNPHDWISTHTPSTADMRTRWGVELSNLSEQLGYKVTRQHADNHYLLEKAFFK